MNNRLGRSVVIVSALLFDRGVFGRWPSGSGLKESPGAYQTFTEHRGLREPHFVERALMLLQLVVFWPARRICCAHQHFRDR